VLNVVSKLREGKSLKDIKREVIKIKNGAKLTLSYGQIRRIERVWKKIVLEKSPKLAPELI